MSLSIVEVIGRSEQGRTQPYICRGDDGEVYFVKGRSATRSGLIAEWLCAQLAESFGLPVAPYEIATVPDELMEDGAAGWLKDLGAGEVFASKRVNAVELATVHCDLISESQKRDVVVFDWWVRNGDRMLTERGGNPNLLWKPDDGGGLVVIDHNLAFDKEFSVENFAKLHVFADEIPTLFSDFLARQAYAERLEAALGIWAQACHNIPVSWGFIDPEQTLPLDYPLAEVKNLLERANTESFWQLEP